MEVDYKTLHIDGIDFKDYQDFVDAFIASGSTKDGIELTEVQLDILNEDRDLVYGLTLEKING